MAEAKQGATPKAAEQVLEKGLLDQIVEAGSLVKPLNLLGQHQRQPLAQRHLHADDRVLDRDGDFASGQGCLVNAFNAGFDLATRLVQHQRGEIDEMLGEIRDFEQQSRKLLKRPGAAKQA